MTDRLRDRVGPMLALLLSYFALGLVILAVGKPDFDKILPFSAGIIGTITGFYFGARSSRA